MSPRAHTFFDLQSMAWEHVTDQFQRKLVTGEQAMMAHLRLAKGCVVPTHSHHNEQISYVSHGLLRFAIGEDEEEILLGAGQVLHLPSHLPHSAVAIEDTVGIDVFSPPRQDWLDGSDDYLRR